MERQRLRELHDETGQMLAGWDYAAWLKPSS
jgi:signal transduction histidine kinase